MFRTMLLLSFVEYLPRDLLQIRMNGYNVNFVLN